MPCIRKAFFFLKTGDTYLKRTTKLLAAVVAMVMLWSVSGHMLWHVARQTCYNYVHHIKKERSFRDTLILDDHVFHNPEKIEWVKKDEIRYEGRMFDIKKQTTAGGVTILIGHYDDFEHYLYKCLGKLFDDDNETQQPKSKQWQTIVALMPERIRHHKLPEYDMLLHSVMWLSRFHYSLNIRPRHNPPDMMSF